MTVRDLTEAEAVDLTAVVREARPATTRAGDPYLRLVLADATGIVAAVRWDSSEDDLAVAVKGAVVRARGSYSVHERYGPQVKLESIAPAEPGSYEMGDLLDGPARDAGQLEDDLRALIETVRDPRLRELLERTLGPESEIWASYRVAPAAKYFHQAYPHGLLEHSLSVASAVSAASASFPGIDRDVAVTGALLHDIGKLEAYAQEGAAIDLTDEGRLQGEIALGYYRVRSLIEAIEGFPSDLGQAVLHIILSHHGALEHGSPVVPCTREAWLVHMIDNLGGKLGSFDRIEKELADGQRWSDYDRALGAGAYFAAREAA